jgi:hypothetical protein
MKNIYTSMIVILMIASSSAQDLTVASNSDIALNHIVSIEVVENTNDDENNSLDFRYYYLPNMFAYFDVTTNKYIYKTNNSWKTAAELPQYYGGYSTFKNLRVPVRNYNGNDPQEKLNEHKLEFPYVKKSRMAQSTNDNGNTALTSSNTELRITLK